MLANKVWTESVQFWDSADMNLAKTLAYAAACSGRRTEVALLP